MKAITPFLPLLVLAAACTSDKSNSNRVDASAPILTEKQVKAIDAAALKAADKVSTANADEKLEDLERQLAAEAEQR